MRRPRRSNDATRVHYVCASFALNDLEKKNVLIARLRLRLHFHFDDDPVFTTGIRSRNDNYRIWHILSDITTWLTTVTVTRHYIDDTFLFEAYNILVKIRSGSSHKTVCIRRLSYTYLSFAVYFQPLFAASDTSCAISITFVVITSVVREIVVGEIPKSRDGVYIPRDKLCLNET